jgi:hypothetical protein
MADIRYTNPRKRDSKPSEPKPYGGVIQNWSIHALFDKTFKIYGMLVEDKLNRFQPNTEIWTSGVAELVFDEDSLEGWIDTNNTRYGLGAPHQSFSIKDIREYIARSKVPD